MEEVLHAEEWEVPQEELQWEVPVVEEEELLWLVGELPPEGVLEGLLVVVLEEEWGLLCLPQEAEAIKRRPIHGSDPLQQIIIPTKIIIVIVLEKTKEILTTDNYNVVQ